MLLLLAACTTEVECTETEPCPFGAVCVEGFCEDIPCSTSAQCGMEQYCDNRSCVDGCAGDSDCYPGYECQLESATCVESGCRDTQLDCNFKEFCNPANAECYEVDGYYCRSCNDNGDCGGDESGNLCLNFGSGNEYCGVECESDRDCPSGFGCLPVGDFNGNIISFQCITYCWLYEDAENPFDVVAPPIASLDPHPVCFEDAEKL